MPFPNVQIYSTNVLSILVIDIQKLTHCEQKSKCHDHAFLYTIEEKPLNPTAYIPWTMRKYPSNVPDNTIEIPTKFYFYLKNTDLGSYTEILFYIYDHGYALQLPFI